MLLWWVISVSQNESPIKPNSVKVLTNSSIPTMPSYNKTCAILLPECNSIQQPIINIFQLFTLYSIPKYHSQEDLKALSLWEWCVGFSIKATLAADHIKFKIPQLIQIDLFLLDKDWWLDNCNKMTLLPYRESFCWWFSSFSTETYTQLWYHECHL